MYLTFGMTPDEYWKGEPELATAYRKKYELETERRNEGYWLQGAYFYDAMLSTVAQALASKNSTPRKYAEEPYRIKPYTEEELKAKREEAEKKARDHAIQQFNLMKAAWDSKHGEVQH